MLALTYQPTPTPVETVVIPEQVANFLNQQPVNHPWQPNSSVFNEPFISQVPVDFSQTYQPEGYLVLAYPEHQEPATGSK
jgi:hypothetical protein